MNRSRAVFVSCCISAAVSLGFVPLGRAASPANESALRGYSSLERSVIAQELARRQLELEPEPEAKLIEQIQIATLEVFDQRDPMPDFVNVLHVTTRRGVILRELLFQEGQPYRSLLAEETARNLRDLIQLSIVLIVPVRGSRPDRVRVLVITKDVWSLRLNWYLQSPNGRIQSLVLNPSEQNLFGSHATVGGTLALTPATYSLGLSLSHRRLLGTHEQVLLAAHLIRNRASGAAEGSFGEFRYGQPLYSLDTKWSFGTSILWRHDIARRFVGVEVARRNGIPVEFHRDRLYGGYQLERSFGRRFKYDVSIGIEAERRIYRAPDLSGYDPRAVAAFSAAELEVSDQRVSPFLQLHAHRTDFGSLIEVETLGLQEDFRRGHDLLLRLYPASRAVGSTRSLIGSQAALSYTFSVPDGLIRPLIGSRLEASSGGRDDALFEAMLHVVSPRIGGLGRLILDGQLLNRARNYYNRRFALGGDTRLRGYAPGAFPGANLIAANAEFRTTSIDLVVGSGGRGRVL